MDDTLAIVPQYIISNISLSLLFAFVFFSFSFITHLSPVIVGPLYICLEPSTRASICNSGCVFNTEWISFQQLSTCYSSQCGLDAGNHLPHLPWDLSWLHFIMLEGTKQKMVLRLNYSKLFRQHSHCTDFLVFLILRNIFYILKNLTVHLYFFLLPSEISKSIGRYFCLGHYDFPLSIILLHLQSSIPVFPSSHAFP